MMDFLDATRWSIRIGRDGTWKCEHIDAVGESQPSTALNLQDAEDAWPDAEPDRKRFIIACPDCGTWWRIWAHALAAQYYAAPPCGVTPIAPRHPSYRQPIQRDIHAIMAAVMHALPECIITQEAAYLPTTHDDGIWYFHLPNVEPSVQIESSSGMCPFLLETDAESGPDALKMDSVDDIVAVIISYFEAHGSPK